MEISLFWAKFLGSLYLLIALAWLLNRSQFEASAKSIISSPPVLALSGLLALILGLAVVISHPIWELSWRGVISLFGLLAVLQGVLRLSFPHLVEKTAHKMMGKNFWIIWAIVALLGAYFAYYGFFWHPY